MLFSKHVLLICLLLLITMFSLYTNASILFYASYFNLIYVADGHLLQKRTSVLNIVYNFIHSIVFLLKHFNGIFQTITFLRDYIFEGDILLNRQQALSMIQLQKKRRRKKRKLDIDVVASLPTKKWSLPINYILDSKYSK